MQHVFVYGTLRAGESNDINRAAERSGVADPVWIGVAHVRGRLFDFGSYPGLVPDESAAPVRGDVYRIDDALVPVLDEIEEVVPGVDGLFRSHRLHVRVALQDAHTDIDCLIYPVTEAAAEGLPRIADGDWVEYHALRMHAFRNGN